MRIRCSFQCRRAPKSGLCCGSDGRVGRGGSLISLFSAFVCDSLLSRLPLCIVCSLQRRRAPKSGLCCGSDGRVGRGGPIVSSDEAENFA